MSQANDDEGRGRMSILLGLVMAALTSLAPTAAPTEDPCLMFGTWAKHVVVCPEVV